MDKFCLFLLVLFSFSRIHAGERDTLKQTVTAVEVRSLTPLGEDFYRIYKTGDLVLLQSHYFFSTNHKPAKSTTTEPTNGNILLEEDSLITERRSNFFVYHKDSLYGYNFDPLNEFKDNKRLLVDSVVRQRTLQTHSSTSTIQLQADSVFWNEDKTVMKERYVCPPTATCPTTITAYYSFVKNGQSGGESLAPLVDSMRNMKQQNMQLFKMEYCFASFWWEPEKRQMPEMYFWHEMLPVRVDNEGEVQTYLARYLKITAQKSTP